MNWVDYIVIGIFLLSILAGLGRGFAKEMISLGTLVAAFVVATMFANSLAMAFTSSETVQSVVSQTSQSMGVSTAQPVSYMALGISYIVLFVGTLLLGSLIGHFVNAAFQAGILGIGNRLLGGLFGLVRGFLINLVVIFVVQLTPFSGESWWQQSKFVASFQPAVQWLGRLVSPSLANLKATVEEHIQGVGSSITNIYQGY